MVKTIKNETNVINEQDVLTSFRVGQEFGLSTTELIQFIMARHNTQRCFIVDILSQAGVL